MSYTRKDAICAHLKEPEAIQSSSAEHVVTMLGLAIWAMERICTLIRLKRKHFLIVVLELDT